jgi:hypothetical protein
MLIFHKEVNFMNKNEVIDALISNRVVFRKNNSSNKQDVFYEQRYVIKLISKIYQSGEYHAEKTKILRALVENKNIIKAGKHTFYHDHKFIATLINKIFNETINETK